MVFEFGIRSLSLIDSWAIASRSVRNWASALRRHIYRSPASKRVFRTESWSSSGAPKCKMSQNTDTWQCRDEALGRWGAAPSLHECLTTDLPGRFKSSRWSFSNGAESNADGQALCGEKTQTGEPWLCAVCWREQNYPQMLPGGLGLFCGLNLQAKSHLLQFTVRLLLHQLELFREQKGGLRGPDRSVSAPSPLIFHLSHLLWPSCTLQVCTTQTGSEKISVWRFQEKQTPQIYKLFSISQQSIMPSSNADKKSRRVTPLTAS